MNIIKLMMLYLLLCPIVLIGLPLWYHDWGTLAVTSILSLVDWFTLWIYYND